MSINPNEIETRRSSNIPSLQVNRLTNFIIKHTANKMGHHSAQQQPTKKLNVVWIAHFPLIKTLLQ